MGVMGNEQFFKVGPTDYNFHIMPSLSKSDQTSIEEQLIREVVFLKVFLTARFFYKQSFFSTQLSLSVT